MHVRVKLPVQNPDVNKFVMQTDAGRFVFNWGLEQVKKRWRVCHTVIPFAKLCARLPKLKKKHTWLLDADANSLQQSLRDLYDGITRWRKKQNRFPKFKSRFEPQQSFRTCVGIQLKSDTIKIGKLGTYRIRPRDKQHLNGRLMSITVMLEGNGRWYISLLLDVTHPKPLPRTRRSVGIDIGTRRFAQAVTGEGRFQKKERSGDETKLLEDIKQIQKRLSRQKKGSKRREKTKLRLRKKHHKLACKRNDFNHKLSRRVVDKFDTIVVEDLGIKNMMKRHNPAKGFQQAACGDFLRKLEYKAEWYGKTLIRVDPKNTTRTCSCCGTINDVKRQTFKKTPEGRWWRCEDCETVHERDRNAAVNILHKGLHQLQLQAPRVPSPRSGKTYGHRSMKRETPSSRAA